MQLMLLLSHGRTQADDFTSFLMLSIIGGKSQDNSKRLCRFYAKKD